LSIKKSLSDTGADDHQEDVRLRENERVGDSLLRGSPVRTAAERTWNNLKGFEALFLKNGSIQGVWP